MSGKKICKHCLRPNVVGELHACLDWHGRDIAQIFNPEHVAGLSDVKEAIQRLSKYRKQK